MEKSFMEKYEDELNNNRYGLLKNITDELTGILRENALLLLENAELRAENERLRRLRDESIESYKTFVGITLKGLVNPEGGE